MGLRIVTRVSDITGNAINRMDSGYTRIKLAYMLFNNIKGKNDLSKALSCIPKYIPPGINVEQNLNEAASMSLWQARKALGNKGKWDYKQVNRDFENFGNWHYMMIVTRMGLPRTLGRAIAGAAQMVAGTSPDSPIFDAAVLFNSSNFGDHQDDQEQMLNYLKLYDANGDINNLNDICEDYSNPRYEYMDIPDYDTRVIENEPIPMN